MSKLAIILLSCAWFACMGTSTLIRPGRTSGDERLKEPKIRSCLIAKVCPVTLDFTPTCASDERTYSNEATIDCVNQCLEPEEKLKVVASGFCKNDVIANS